MTPDFHLLLSRMPTSESHAGNRCLPAGNIKGKKIVIHQGSHTDEYYGKIEALLRKHLDDPNLKSPAEKLGAIYEELARTAKRMEQGDGAWKLNKHGVSGGNYFTTTGW
ncbi:MAG: hypothetical protein N2C14_15940 [Planctomycetales bacterium]